MLNYREYLQSPAWRTKAIGFKTRANWRCQRCGADHFLGNKLEVHHLHYRTLGGESHRDVIVLCGPCHKLAHERTAAT